MIRSVDEEELMLGMYAIKFDEFSVMVFILICKLWLQLETGT